MAPGELPRGVGPRVALFLRDLYPQDRAKLLARDFKISVSTAQRWLDGKAPTTAQLEEMVEKWGEPFLQLVFAESFRRHDPRIQQLITARTAMLKEVSRRSPPLQRAQNLLEVGAAPAQAGWSDNSRRYSALPPPRYRHSKAIADLSREVPPSLGDLLRRLWT